MDAVYTALHGDLTTLASNLKTVVPSNEPLSVAHGAWNLPGITRDELVALVETFLQMILKVEGDEEPKNSNLLADYRRRIAFLTSSTIPQI